MAESIQNMRNPGVRGLKRVSCPSHPITPKASKVRGGIRESRFMYHLSRDVGNATRQKESNLGA